MSHPFSFFEQKKGSLFCGQVNLRTLAEKLPTPFYVYSGSGMLESFDRLQRGVAPLKGLVCFAAKSNSNQYLLSQLRSRGAGLDIVSGGELFRAKTAGFSGDHIVFSGVGKSDQEIEEALLYDNKKGIYSFNVESVPELLNISRLAKRLQTSARVALRFNPNVNAKTHPYISTGLKENKFGLSQVELFEALSLCKKLPNLSVAGLSIHIGSQILSLSPLKEAYLKLRSLYPKVEAFLGYSLQFLDLGGGMGVAYSPKQKPLEIEAATSLIRTLFASSQKKILIEPGRTITANAGALITRVLYVKKRGKKTFLILDAGMNDLMRPALYQSYHHLVSLTGHPGPSKPFQVVGPVCETSDRFHSSFELPEKTSAGDLIAILSAGAYGFSMANSYNSRPRPAEYWVEKKKILQIRQAETYSDLLKTETLKKINL